jgi:hypothetical protein
VRLICNFYCCLHPVAYVTIICSLQIYNMVKVFYVSVPKELRVSRGVILSVSLVVSSSRGTDNALVSKLKDLRNFESIPRGSTEGIDDCRWNTDRQMRGRNCCVSIFVFLDVIAIRSTLLLRTSYAERKVGRVSVITVGTDVSVSFKARGNRRGRFRKQLPRYTLRR